MSQLKQRYFVALLTPQSIQDCANQIKQHFADHHGSRAALKSPPHITLQPPFTWFCSEQVLLETSLQEFAIAQSAVPVTLNGFAAFPPRVIYINVLRTSDLLALQTSLMDHCESKLGIVDPVGKQRPFVPHLTVAFRDLTPPNFQAAWPEFQDRPFDFEFTASHLTLLRHDGMRWNTLSEFRFQSQSSLALTQSS
jgi:2'-5' RNA ligase